MSLEIPDFLKHLPVHRGYPVPYFVPKDENGVYQLKYGSLEKMQTCLKYHKCCVCFKPLITGQYYFISGPKGLETQTDSHSPMHKECAEFSLKVCPHLFFEKTHRTTDEKDATPWQIVTKPSVFYLVRAKKIKVFYPLGQLVVKYLQIESLIKFAYKDGQLAQDATL
jgi:hypothetical protein